MARDALEYDVGGLLRDTTGRPEWMVKAKHTALLSTDVSRGYEPADADGRPQLVLVDANGNDLASTILAGVGGPVESVPSGAVQYIFQARAFGVVADAVVDANGQFISGTDDTAAWLRLIAALPADKAVIRLHGMSLVSAQLGFNTSDLSLIGDGPHTGFVLAKNTNTNVLRFNTSGLNVGPPRLQRVYLENFLVDHQGYYQTDPGGGIAGALVAYALLNFTAKNIMVRNAKSTAMNITACRRVDIDEPFIDTVIPGGGANGINCLASPTLGSTFLKVHDGHLIDIPDKAIDAGGLGADSLTIGGNTVETRNLRPGPAGISGNPFIGFQPGGTTASAWSNLTNYALGAFVSNGGFNYVALVISGPSNGGAVTPGTNNLVWWLQAPPLAWSSATAYVVGQPVYYTAPTGHNGQLEGGITANYTCIVPSTNNPPVDGSGNVDSHWQLGGPITASARSAGTIGAETTPSPSTRDVTVTGNVIWGQNLGGEYVIGNGIQVSSSKVFPGISAVNTTVSGNTIRGCGLAIIANDEVTNVTGNTIDDCTSGIQVGMPLSFGQRNLLVGSNTIRLGGTGGGTAIVVSKAVASFPFSQAHVSDNLVDGAMGPTMYLSSTVTGGPLTTVPVAHVTTALPTGQVVLLGKLPQGGSGIIQAVTLTAPAAVGDTSLTVGSFTAATTFSTGGGVTPLVGTITGTLASGVPITSIPVTALVAAYQYGTTFTIPNSTGGTPLNVTLSVAAKVGDTALTVNSVTPTTTYASGLPVGVWGTTGISVQGGVTQSELADNAVTYCSLWGYAVAVNVGTPSAIDLADCWSYNCGGHATIGSTIPGVRVLGGGFVAAASGASFAGSGANFVLRRGVSGINPGGVVTGPGVPASTVNATNQTGFDCTVYVTGGTVTDIKVGGTTLGGPISGPVRVVAGQTISITYSVAPTWVWVAD